MELFVRSCGVGPEHGYRWVRVSDSGQVPAEPAMLRNLKIYDLIEHEAFSVGLEFTANRFCLLITGLRATQSGDYQHRRIVSSLACIGTHTDTSLLRGIAATALRGEFEQLADTFIRLDPNVGNTGFRVSADMIQHLARYTARGNQRSDYPEPCIGNYNERLKSLLAQELDEREFPPHHGVLVLVTKHIDPQRLKLARTWRGLSTLFDGDETRWYLLNEVKLNLQGKNLSNVDLHGFDLTEANLSGANLSGTNLSGLDLRGANLSGANLSGANLSGANLSGANLSKARLWNTDLTAADLRDANLRETFLLLAKLKDVVHNERTIWPPLFAGIPKYRR